MYSSGRRAGKVALLLESAPTMGMTCHETVTLTSRPRRLRPWSTRLYLLRRLVLEMTASSRSSMILSNTTTWFTPLRGLSYSTATKTNSCLVFQLNTLRRSAYTSITTYASSLPDGSSYIRSTLLMDARTSGVAEWKQSVSMAPSAITASVVPAKVSSALARTSVECIAPTRPQTATLADLRLSRPPSHGPRPPHLPDCSLFWQLPRQPQPPASTCFSTACCLAPLPSKAH
mmetsp:Transcript_45583/g.116609  ORF Transcript_45583/g.116609 Transcript_45583/m.116609 type:complete len:231 (-) Transcript_45583:282-974(-)